MNEHRALKPESEALSERLRILKETIPECFSEGRLDPEKLRESLGEDNLDEGPERYGLNWPGKREARARAFKPSNMALHLEAGEGVNEKDTKNLIIEGENLEVLRLLQKAYRGRVKMIYIDPPYNTGNDFVYDDKFAESPLEYEKRTGLRAEDGTALQSNRKSSGRYHSNWLSMMYPRLVLARELLSEDGLLFLSIDDNEIHNIRQVFDEVFGAENFVDCIIWKKRYGGGAKEKYLVSMHEYILMYARSIEYLEEILVPLSKESIERYYKSKDEYFSTRGPFRTHPLESMKSFEERPNLKFPIISPDGKKIMPKRQWRWGKERVEEAAKNGELYFSKDKNGNWVVSSKQYLLNGEEQRETKFPSVIDDVYTQHATNEVVSIYGNAQIFSFPKPSLLIKKLLLIISAKHENAIILDFFAGSGTTAQAVLELNEEDGGNRQFILVQMPEATPEDSEARKAGYETIAEIAKERVRRVIKKLDKEKGKLTDRDRGFHVFKLAKTGFRQWQDYAGASLEEYEKQLSLHLAETDGKVKDADLVAEIMLREGFPLDSKIERIEDGALKVTRIESEASAHRLFICLDSGFGKSLTVRTFEKLGVAPEDVFVCLDGALSDEAKLRIRELCKLATV